jgi:hypothetical protein
MLWLHAWRTPHVVTLHASQAELPVPLSNVAIDVMEVFAPAEVTISNGKTVKLPLVATLWSSALLARMRRRRFELLAVGISAKGSAQL